MNEKLDQLLELTAAPVPSPVEANDALSAQGRFYLRVFLGFLAVTALFAVITILSEKFGKFEIKVLASTLTVSLGSLCAMCCVKFGALRGQALWARAGVALTVAAAALLLIGYWSESDWGKYWKLAIILSIFAAANAHVCALCFARLAPGHLWLLVSGALVIYLLALLLAAIVGNSQWERAPFTLIAVLAVLDLGITIAVPILHRLDHSPQAVSHAAEATSLAVIQNVDGSYSLPDGRVLVLKD